MLPYSTFPLQLSLQKFVLYETKAVRNYLILLIYIFIFFPKHNNNTYQRFYLVGSNRVKTKFKLLKIDRTYGGEPNYEISINEDATEYNRSQIQELLSMFLDLENLYWYYIIMDT